MSEYYCNFFDKTNKFTHKKKYSNTKSQMDLSESLINNYCDSV